MGRRNCAFEPIDMVFRGAVYGPPASVPPISNFRVRFAGSQRQRYRLKVNVWAKTGGYCTYCRSVLAFRENFEMDHALPKSRGGKLVLSNLVPACVPCNRRKSNASREEFEVVNVTQAMDEMVSGRLALRSEAADVRARGARVMG